MTPFNTDDARKLLEAIQKDKWYPGTLAVEEENEYVYRVYRPDFSKPNFNRPAFKSQSAMKAEIDDEKRRKMYFRKLAKDVLGRDVTILLGKVRKTEVECATV